MGPVEALELALSKEIESIELYKDYAEHYHAAADTFLFLLREENKHKILIEKRIIELTRL